MTETCACVRVTAPPKLPIFVDGKMVGVGPLVVVPAMQPGTHEAFVVAKGKMNKQRFEFPAVRELDLTK
jgi:hypothetical protein